MFCWFQLVGNLFCFEQAGITGYVLARNVYGRKKKIFLKVLPIAAFFKTRLQENQRLGPIAAFLYKNAAKIGSIAAFLYKNAAIDLNLWVVKTKGWDL